MDAPAAFAPPSAAVALAAAFVLVPALHAAAPNLTHHTHRARHMGDQTWGYNVYLPEGYAGSTARYPVLYMLHGYGDTENRMTFMAETLHKAIAAGQVPKIIMVFPNGGKQTFYCDYDVWKWTPGINADSYISKELIPHIDSAFRTIPAREGRLVQGFSMGGWGSLHFAFKYPEMFSRVCALAPGGRNVDDRNHPMALSESNAAAIKAGVKVRLVVGNNDNLKPQSEAFRSLWNRLGIAHEWEVVPGVAHSPEGLDRAAGVRNLQFLTRDLTVSIAPRPRVRPVPAAEAWATDAAGRLLPPGSRPAVFPLGAAR